MIENCFPKVAEHSQNRYKMPILKGGVDGFSNFSFFSVILFSNQDHPSWIGSCKSYYHTITTTTAACEPLVNYVESGIKHHNPNPGNILVSTYNKYYNYHQPLFDHHLDNLENQEILEKKPWLCSTFNRYKMPILKGGVDGFRNFSFFSVILFSNQDHPCWIGSCKSNYHTITTTTAACEPLVTWIYKLCSATFGKQFSEKNSWNRLNNWKKIIPDAISAYHH
jgi:hypothetical protein